MPETKTDETALLCLAIALLGIAGLWAYGRSVEPRPAELGTLSAQDVGRWVFVEGKVIIASRKAGSYSLRICSPDCVNAFVPLPKDGNRTVSRGDFVALTGIVKEYRGELEVAAQTPADWQVRK